jgi:hypothetical protein
MYIGCSGSIKANGEGSAKVTIYTNGRIYTRVVNSLYDYLPNDGRFTIISNGGYYRYTGSTAMTVSADGTVTAPNRGTVEGPRRRVVVKTSYVHREDPLQGGTHMINPSVSSDQTYTGLTAVEVEVWQEENRKNPTSEITTGFDLDVNENNEILMSNGYAQTSGGRWGQQSSTSTLLLYGLVDSSSVGAGQIPVYSETYYITYEYTSGADGGSETKTLISDWYSESGETMEVSNPIVTTISLPDSPSWLHVNEYGNLLTASGNTSETCRSATAICTYNGNTKTITIKQCRGYFSYQFYGCYNVEYEFETGTESETIHNGGRIDFENDLDNGGAALISFELRKVNRIWSDWDVDKTKAGIGTPITSSEPGTIDPTQGVSNLYCYLSGESASHFAIFKSANGEIDESTQCSDLNLENYFETTSGSNNKRLLYVAPIDDGTITETQTLTCDFVINAYYKTTETLGDTNVNILTQEDVIEDHGDQAYDIRKGMQFVIHLSYEFVF